MLKYLRIAVTALSLTACVLLIALWVRSYTALEAAQAHVFGQWLVHLQSARGNVLVFTVPEKYLSLTKKSGISPSRFSSVPYAEVNALNVLEIAVAGDASYKAYIVPDRRICHLPYFVPVLFVAAIAYAPWIKRRFTLRTLLIGTTLVAVALGIVVAAIN